MLVANGRGKMKHTCLSAVAIILWACCTQPATGEKATTSPAEAERLAKALTGPMRGVEEVVFAVRSKTYDHWYANFGYWTDDANRMAYGRGGTRLCRLNLRSGKLKVILEDGQGSIRDPKVHYDGRTILFSYRKGTGRYYNLYEIQADGTGLRQVTRGPWDDIEPTYLPDDRILFISSRCKRWVPCWRTQVGILYRCDRKGGKMVAMSSNVEHENTPWVLPNGQVLYTRWEYLERSVTAFHQLWILNPDGTGAMVFAGNSRSGPRGVLIDAKPIPGTNKVVTTQSPDHGRADHDGALCIFDPDGGPDDSSRLLHLGGTKDTVDYRDPYAFAEDCILAAQGPRLVLMNAAGEIGTLYSETWEPVPRSATVWITEMPRGRLGYDYRRAFNAAVAAGGVKSEDQLAYHYQKDCWRMAMEKPGPEPEMTHAEARDVRHHHGCCVCAGPMEIHEPRPLRQHPRERVVPDRTDPTRDTGRLVLADITHGRNMAGVERGEVKKLLVMEELPRPVGCTGRAHMIYGGTGSSNYCLHRILGTVPVEKDGSAYFEVPALRSLFFVALDANDMAVKRMQSFVTVMPGETTGCVGCHEYRYDVRGQRPVPRALHRPASEIEPVAGVPDIIDYRRHVQPILDKHCVKCHDRQVRKRRPGGVPLVGEGSLLTSFEHLARLTGIGKASVRGWGNGNLPPRSAGSVASKLLKMIDEHHQKVSLTARERDLIRVWIDSGAQYAGTYAALEVEIARDVFQDIWGRRRSRMEAGTRVTWTDPTPCTKVFERRCSLCHPQVSRRALAVNFHRPEESWILLAPLAKQAGGWDLCVERLGEQEKVKRVLQAKDTKQREQAVQRYFKGNTAHFDQMPATKEIFKDGNDPDYRILLSEIRKAKVGFDKLTLYDRPGYRPGPQYVREMKRWGILPAIFDSQRDPTDVYELDRAYFRSLWWHPEASAEGRWNP